MVKTKKVVLSGIFSALAVLFLYGAGTLPTGRLALFCIASGLGMITTAECGWRYALAGYGATSAVALILLPDKLLVLPYLLFLGYYPVVKLGIEQFRNLGKEWILKIILFLVVSSCAVFGVVQFMPGVALPFAPWLIAVAGVAVLAVYDVALSLFMQFYRERIMKMIRNGEQK